MKKSEIGWAITGKYGFYSGAGWYKTKKEAIFCFVRKQINLTWMDCVEAGCKAVKIQIKEI